MAYKYYTENTVLIIQKSNNDQDLEKIFPKYYTTFSSKHHIQNT